MTQIVGGLIFFDSMISNQLYIQKSVRSVKTISVICDRNPKKQKTTRPKAGGYKLVI